MNGFDDLNGLNKGWDGLNQGFEERFKLLELFEQFEQRSLDGLNGLNYSLEEEGSVSVKYFEDLEVWRSARELTNRIYEVSAAGAFSKDYGLRDQMRRAAVSVMSNVAEGYERGGNPEFIQFLSIAKGSCGEVRCQLYVAADQGYLPKEQADQMIESLKRLSVMISNFIEYLKGSRYQGAKYKKVYKSMREEVEGIVKDHNERKV